MKYNSDYQTMLQRQFEAANPTVSNWVAANAGAGKTKVLIDRAARLLLSGKSPDSILCITYTKAAANEMKTRLFDRLGQWSVLDDLNLRDVLSQLEGRPKHEYEKGDFNRARTLFARALEIPGGLRIETIHAFCNRILQRFPLEAGILPGFTAIEETQIRGLWDAVLDEIALNSDQDAMIRSDIKTLSLAAAGHGWRSALNFTMLHRDAFMRGIKERGGLEATLKHLADLLHAPQIDEEILVQEAMGKALPRKDLRSILPVLHSSKAKTDQTLAQYIEYALSDAPANKRLARYKDWLLTQKGELRKANPYTKAVADKLHIAELFQIKGVPQGSETLRLMALYKDLTAQESFTRSAALIRIAYLACQNYAYAKACRNWLDFDDLIQRTRDLITNDSGVNWVMYKLDGGLSDILLDEAQDNSPSQWVLLNGMWAEFFSGQGVADKPRTLFVVGDKKQSIYSFQGADPDRFLSERRDFITKQETGKLSGQALDMQMSFRTTPDILRYVDTVFNNEDITGKAPFSVTPPDEADRLCHNAFRKDERGLVELWDLTPPDPVKEIEAFDLPLDYQSPSSPTAKLAQNISEKIKKDLDHGMLVWDRNAAGEAYQRPLSPGDIMILFRKRNMLFHTVIKTLKAAGLPLAGADRILLREHLAVQDLLNLIRFALLPEDDLTLAEILKGPFCDLDEETLFDLAHNRNDQSLWQAVQNSSHAITVKAKKFLASILTRRSVSAYAFLSNILHNGPDESAESGWVILQARFGTQMLEPVEVFLERAQACDAFEVSSLQYFLNQMEHDDSNIKRENTVEGNLIRVMTVHGAKGLEAPYLVLPDTISKPNTRHSSDPHILLDETGLPFWPSGTNLLPEKIEVLQSLETEKALAEHRRLLYVALTRARDYLLVCGTFSMHKSCKDRGYFPQSWYEFCKAGFELLEADRDFTQTDQGYRFGHCSGFEKNTPNTLQPDKPLPDWLFKKAPVAKNPSHIISPSVLNINPPKLHLGFDTPYESRGLRGKLIHILFELLPDIAKDKQYETAEQILTRYPLTVDIDKAEIIEATLNVLHDLKYKHIFSENSRSEVSLVGRGKDLPDDYIVQGRIDRLCEMDHHILAIDFKTDRPAPDSPEKITPAYLTQMACYRSVLEQTYPNKQIQCALLWTDGPKLMHLPDKLMDIALKDIRK